MGAALTALSADPVASSCWSKGEKSKSVTTSGERGEARAAQESRRLPVRSRQLKAGRPLSVRALLLPEELPPSMLGTGRDREDWNWRVIVTAFLFSSAAKGSSQSLPLVPGWDFWAQAQTEGACDLCKGGRCDAITSVSGFSTAAQSQLDLKRGTSRGLFIHPSKGAQLLPAVAIQFGTKSPTLFHPVG